jgi:hypothetical protein
MQSLTLTWGYIRIWNADLCVSRMTWHGDKPSNTIHTHIHIHIHNTYTCISHIIIFAEFGEHVCRMCFSRQTLWHVLLTLAWQQTVPPLRRAAAQYSGWLLRFVSYMCVYVYVCVHTHTHTHIHTYIHTHIHRHGGMCHNTVDAWDKHGWWWIFVNVCGSPMWLFFPLWCFFFLAVLTMYVYYVTIYMYVCMYVCIQIRKCIYIHT